MLFLNRLSAHQSLHFHIGTPLIVTLVVMTWFYILKQSNSLNIFCVLISRHHGIELLPLTYYIYAEIRPEQLIRITVSVYIVYKSSHQKFNLVVNTMLNQIKMHVKKVF